MSQPLKAWKAGRERDFCSARDGTYPVDADERKASTHTKGNPDIHIVLHCFQIIELSHKYYHHVRVNSPHKSCDCGIIAESMKQANNDSRISFLVIAVRHRVSWSTSYHRWPKQTKQFRDIQIQNQMVFMKRKYYFEFQNCVPEVWLMLLSAGKSKRATFWVRNWNSSDLFSVVCSGWLDQFIHIFISLELMRYESRTGFNEIQAV